MVTTVMRPWKLMVTDFEGGTGAFIGMASPVCGGLAAMLSWVCGVAVWATIARGVRNRAAVRIASFMGIRVYRVRGDGTEFLDEGRGG